MVKRKRRPVYGKLQKTWVLKRNKQYSAYAPPTKSFNRNNLLNMLNTYGLVYVKPNFGCHGLGVMKVERTSKARYHVKAGLGTRVFDSYGNLFRHIKRNVGSQNYIVQKGIRLISYNNRPFDIRVMVQRSVKTNNWHVTGMAARVAAPRRIVTNFNKGRNGASIRTVRSVLSKHFSQPAVENKTKMLRQMGINVSRHFQKTYPRLKEIGLDVVFDHKHKAWLLEVNTTYPSAFMFKYLKDKSMYYRMKRFKRTYKD